MKLEWGMNLGKRILLLLLGLLSCLSLDSRNAVGAGQVVWEEPMRIAGPGYVNYPDLVVDSQGRVHFFYSQGTTGNSLDNAIYYRYLDGEQLSAPIDVLITPGSVDARTPSVILDDYGVVHLVWVGGSDIWYSQAPIDTAGNATSWSKPILLDGPTASNTRPAFVLTTGDELRLAYIIYGENPGIYVIESKDRGLNWDAPVRVVDPQGRGLAPVSLSMCTDQSEGMMHIVWYEGDTYSRGLAAQDIYYIKQLGDLFSWTDPDHFDSVSTGNYESAYGPSMPSIACNQSAIYIYWYGAPMGQRHFRFSLDNGDNWRDMGRISDFRGLTYPAALAFDRNGLLYAATGSLDNRLMLMVYDTQSWSGVYPIDINSMGPHYPRMVSENGQKLHGIWQEVMTNEIWYREGMVSSIPDIPANDQIDNDLVAQPFVTVPVSSPTAELAQEDHTPSIPLPSESTRSVNLSPNGTIAISSVSVLLVLIVGFLASRYKGGRRG
jgi:hypothetical protein